MMKVALVDNMNNNFFSLTRYFRDEGIAADLYLTDSTTGAATNSHFSVANDTFKNVDQLGYIYQFPVRYHWQSFFSQKNKKIILDTFRSYDEVIACGFSVALLHWAGVKIKMFIPYGSDLYELGQKQNNSLKEVLNYLLLKRYQREGIKAAEMVITNSNHIIMGNATKQMGLNGINLGIPMVYNQEEFKSDQWDFLDEKDFIVFNHSRQLWKSNQDLPEEDFLRYGGNKRNDKVIRAFARFVQITNFKKPVLILFSYGVDVEESKALISELGIESYIHWMNKMPRKEILAGLKLANFAVDQLRNNIVGIGGTSLESMSVGIPTITHTNYSTSNPNDYYYEAPFIDILEEDEVLDVFKEYERSPEKYLEIGKLSKKWFDTKLGKGLIKEYIRLIK